MQYRKMGKTGLYLSEISLGTMYYGSYISSQQGVENLNKAIDVGINFIDCADRYGIKDHDLERETIPAEKVVGEFLKDHERYDLVLSTKVHHQLRESLNSGGLGKKHIKEQLQFSLKNLGTDYVDIYYCHRTDRTTDLEETVRTMTNLIDEGKVNYWGTSWWPPYMVERAIGIAKHTGCIPPSVEQPPYHLRARFIESDLFHVATFHGLGLTPFEGLSLGLFTGKYNEGIPEGSRFAEMDLISEERMQKIIVLLKQMQDLADEVELEMYQLALSWVLSHKEITSTITGARLPEQVEMNTTASGIELNNDIVQRLEEIFAEQAPKYNYQLR